MATWNDRVDRVRSAVDQWSQRLPDAGTPQPGSSLAADDAVFPRLSCSQLAWYALGVGVEHLDATLRLLQQQVDAGGPVLPDANYTLLRAALVGSSQAVVLLCSTSREQRTTVALQIAHEEYRQLYNFREHVLQHAGLVAQAKTEASTKDYLKFPRERREQVAALLTDRKAGLKITDTRLVEKAADLVHTRGADAQLLQLAVEMEWRLGSGAAHGRLLMGLQRPGGHQIEGDVAAIGGVYDDVAQQVCAVSLMLSEAWRAWDLRVAAP